MAVVAMKQLLEAGVHFGTKKQAQECMKEAAIKCGMYYVDQRWLGGMLTNFGTIQKRIQRLKDLETMEQDGTFDLLPKKEVILLKKEMEKLERNLGGIKDMDKLPGVIFLVMANAVIEGNQGESFDAEDANAEQSVEEEVESIEQVVENEEKVEE